MIVGAVNVRIILEQDCHVHISLRLLENVKEVLHIILVKDGFMIRKMLKLKKQVGLISELKEFDNLNISHLLHIPLDIEFLFCK